MPELFNVLNQDKVYVEFLFYRKNAYFCEI